ncbi:MAG: UDP-N-acetylglucosamine--N-acetylmuramyl-(pentapeptide) pyrophosphoryl-undecaprenol N-acetylglucosamine transferase [Lentisphaeraceae bacterium]|nr:UDP-N-acetylglucosamine--N-acetylmuramyl-(pentapeptide) pyrophosphoryl-undecaprenol N-acetylglucosamine transferase [Lentisphaeraceae bacterium]
MSDSIKEQEFSIIISCGGTGGHFYPGLSIAREFAEQGANVRLFVAGKHVVSQQKQAESFNISADCGRALRLPKAKWAYPFFMVMFAWTVLQSVFYLLQKRPKAVLVMGSFAGVPLGMATTMLGIPLYLHEGNTVVGKANRFLSRWARKLFLSFEVVNGRSVKCESTEIGMPLRPEILKYRPDSDTKKWKEQLGFSSDLPLLMVFGGSQGAMKINKAFYESLALIKSRFQFIHLSGQQDNSYFEECARRYSINARIETSTDKMAEYIQAADLFVCRSGASSLAELIHFEKSALFIPLKIAAENHQVRNAQLAQKAGAAEILLEDELSGEVLAEYLNTWLEKPQDWHEKAGKMACLSRKSVSKTLVKSIVSAC